MKGVLRKQQPQRHVVCDGRTETGGVGGAWPVLRYPIKKTALFDIGPLGWYRLSVSTDEEWVCLSSARTLAVYRLVPAPAVAVAVAVWQQPREEALTAFTSRFTLLIGTYQRRDTVFEVEQETGKVSHTYTIPFCVYCLASAGECFMCSDGARRVWLFALGTGAFLRDISVVSGLVRTLGFRGEEGLYVTTGSDLHVWSVDSVQCLQTFACTNAEGVNVTPGGELLVAVYNASRQFVVVAQGRVVNTLPRLGCFTQCFGQRHMFSVEGTVNGNVLTMYGPVFM